MERFEKLFVLKLRCVHGEAMSTDLDAIVNAMPRINRIISNYACRDVWNAGEFGLLYRQTPSWTLARGQISEFKKDESRITFLACCDNNGTKRMPLMVIGIAWRPHLFIGRTGAKLSFDDHAKERVRMTKNLFFVWLGRLHSYIRRTVAARSCCSWIIAPHTVRQRSCRQCRTFV